MITGEISFHISAQDNNSFRMMKKNWSKMASLKVEICVKKNKLTPSTNNPLLSYRNSEQKQE